MEIADQLPQWLRDKSEICARISNIVTPFKILLKTRDEPTRLKAWIAHHSSIVGPENLIIFDHMSIDPEVLSIYAEFSGIIPVIRFSGFHNNVHNVDLFPELYKALRQSCGHFCFLDTDEYLVLFDGANRFESGSHIVEFLARHKGIMAFPGTWLQALKGHANRFNLHTPIWPLSDGLQWGKPVISSAFDVSGIILHNTEVKRALALADLKTNLFVLHRHMSLPDERISINIQKLKSSGHLKPGDGIEEALKLEVDPLKPRHNYIQEIHELIASKTPKPIEGSFEINAAGDVEWSQDWQRYEMQRFLAEPNLFSERLFSER